ncbi:MAG: hypothetical protein QXP38_06805 [Nitrososphaerota archaeon]
MNKANLIYLIREIWGNAFWMTVKTEDPEFEMRARKIMKICDDITEDIIEEVK